MSVFPPAMPGRAACALGMVLIVAGCQPRTDKETMAETSPAAEASPSSSPARQGAHAVTGTATYRERIRMPPGAKLRVQLIDSLLADTPTAVLSDVTLDDVAGPPYAFRLPYDPAKLRPNGQYGVHASLYGPDGVLWFVSDTRVPVDPAHNQPVEIPMVRVPSPGDTPGTNGNATHWQCGEMRVSATFATQDGPVSLGFNGRSLSLPLARSASGARYADEQGNEFWTKGDGGTLSLKDEDKRDCRRADGPSPWDTAKARNVAFRAVGNEPGWLVEVGRGDAPPLHAELDYGSRKIDIAQVQRSDDGNRFAGTTGDGTKVELRIERKPCRDDMSGSPFDATAQLVVGNQAYRGCGAFLVEER